MQDKSHLKDNKALMLAHVLEIKLVRCFLFSYMKYGNLAVRLFLNFIISLAQKQ